MGGIGVIAMALARPSRVNTIAVASGFQRIAARMSSSDAVVREHGTASGCSEGRLFAASALTFCAGPFY
jgi:hypothetical protein